MEINKNCTNFESTKKSKVKINENCGIYFIRNKTNNKIYVGQSINIPQRLRAHMSNARIDKRTTNRHLYNSLRKYGSDNFEWGILQICDVKDLSECEAYWIGTLNSMDREKGYNNKLYDERSNEIHSSETREKISIALKNKPKSQSHINNMPTKFSKDYLPDEAAIKKRVITMKARYKAGNNLAGFKTNNIPWNKGLTTPESTRDKQRFAKLGKKLSKSHREALSKAANANKVAQFTIKGKFVRWWDTANNITIESNKYLSISNIRGCCNGNKPYYLDAIFRYKKDIKYIDNPQIDNDELIIIGKRYEICKNRSARGTYFRPNNNNIKNFLIKI